MIKSDSWSIFFNDVASFYKNHKQKNKKQFEGI